MQNGILTLNWQNVLDAVLTSAFFAVLAGLVTVVTGNGFNVFTTNWIQVGENMVNTGFIAAVVSLGKDLLSTNNGSFLAIGPNTPPAAPKPGA